jgi:hypothetical protein
LDRQFWLMIALAALVLLPRSYLITRSQSERVDDEYHIQRGVMFLNRQMADTDQFPLNDPPLGEGLTVLPLWMMHTWHEILPLQSAIWNQRFKPDTILNCIGLWKSLLLLPMLGVVFAWLRELYGTKSAWLAVAMLLIDPTLAAHAPLPTVDVLGAEGIVIACFAMWKYFQQPTWRRLTLAAITMAVALLLKHTAILLPGVAMIFATMWWIVRPWREDRLRESWQGKIAQRLGMLFAAAGIVLLMIWALCLFDISKPRFPSPDYGSWTAKWENLHPLAARMLDCKLPAGIYIGSILQAQMHATYGHMSYLFGEKRISGWWYYFPVVATYKVPIGIGVVLLMGIISLKWIKPRWGEWSLLIPMLAWSAFMMGSKIDIGFRHFLPAYVFMIMLASRIMLHDVKAWLAVAWIALAAAGADTLRYHPDYLCYINFPRQDVWKQISDSNVDWGQGLKYVRRWIDTHPNRQIFVRDFGWAKLRLSDVSERLGPRVTLLDRNSRPPTHGVLIISPVPLVGIYDLRWLRDPFAALRDQKPIAILGHSMRVYDLDRLRKPGQPFHWGRPPAIRPTTKETP